MIELIWQEIQNIAREHKRIFVLCVLAFTCACVGINASLSNCLIANAESSAAEISYGNKASFKITMNGDSDTFCRVFSNENSGKVKELFEALRTDPLFTYRYTTENLLDFFDPQDASYGAADFPPFREEFRVGYEDGSTIFYNDYLALKAIYADTAFCSDYGVVIEEGRAFQPEDFIVRDPESIVLPVLLGAKYRGMYELGDRIEKAHLGTEHTITLEVIGFFKSGSSFYDNNTMKVVLDRYMVVPTVETAYDGRQPDGTYDEFTHAAYDSMKLMNARLYCDTADYQRVQAEAGRLFREYGFSELRLFEESEGSKNYLQQTHSAAVTSIVITCFIVVMIAVMMCIQTYYRIIRNKKKYSILMLNGITAPQMFLLIAVETLLVFVLSALLFFVLKWLLRNQPYLDMGLSRYSALCIAAIELVLLIAIGFFGVSKIRQVDMSTVLREHE